MQYKDLNGKEPKELMALIAEMGAELHSLYLKRSLNQLKDVRSIREHKKDIARMQTRLGALKN